MNNVEYPLITNLDTWNYLILYKYYIESTKLKTRKEIYENFINNFSIDSTDLEVIIYWAIEQKFNMRLKVYKIKENETEKYFITLKLPGYDYKTTGFGQLYLEEIRQKLPSFINLDIYEII